MQALFTVAWPKGFYAIETIDVASCNYGKLRAFAMASLKWDKQGASSIVQFGLRLDPRVGPEFYVLELVMLSFRRMCAPDLAFPVLSRLVANPPKRLTSGPCGAARL